MSLPLTKFSPRSAEKAIFARRSCTGNGHILLSRNVAEVLEQFSDWQECLHDLGVHEVKHGVTIHLYSLVKAPVGNPEIPSKLIAEARRRRFALGSNARRWFTSNRKEILRRVMLFAGVFLFACVVALLFEQWMDVRIGRGESTGAAAQATFALRRWPYVLTRCTVTTRRRHHQASLVEVLFGSKGRSHTYGP